MRRTVWISLAAGLMVALLSLFPAPDPHRLGTAVAGDRALAGRTLDVLGGDTGGYHSLSVAFVDRDRVTTALLGEPDDGRLFETGSITKTMTGMLLADMADEGVVSPQDTLGDTLPDAGLPEPTASITLEELASQRSGLPRLAPGWAAFLRGAVTNMTGGNPYAGDDLASLLESAADAEPGDSRGEVGYSNFGMALLGHALAAKAGVPYPELLAQRILRPLGMTDTHVLPPDTGVATGSVASGLTSDPWISEGYAPAGVAMVSTAADLGRFVAATMAGTAPGASAATPRFDGEPGERIGYAWFTDRYGDRDITWHNGATGGFSSYVGFDPATGQGVVVLGDTDRAVEWIGMRLLGVDVPAGVRSASPGLPRVLVTVALLVYGATGLLFLAFAPRLSRPDRLRAIGGVLTMVAVMLLVHRVGTWLTVPPWLWPVAAGGAGAGLAGLVLRWRSMPLIADGRPGLRWVAFAISAALSVAVVWLLVLS